MRWERGDLLVGLVVVAASVLLIGGTIWFAAGHWSAPYSIHADFDRADGVSERVPVLLDGYAVGRVERIEPRFGRDGRTTFRIRLGLNRQMGDGDSLYLPEGTRAVLVPAAFLGNPSVNLEIPEEGGPPLASGAFVPGAHAPAAVEQLQRLAEGLGGEAEGVLVRSGALLDSMALALGRMDGTVRRLEGSVSEALAGATRQTEMVGTLLTDLRGQIGEVGPRTALALDSLTHLLGDSRGLVRDLDSTVESLRPQLVATAESLERTSVVFQHFVAEVSRRPTRVFFGVDPPDPQEPVADD